MLRPRSVARALASTVNLRTNTRKKAWAFRAIPFHGEGGQEPRTFERRFISSFLASPASIQHILNSNRLALSQTSSSNIPRVGCASWSTVKSDRHAVRCSCDPCSCGLVRRSIGKTGGFVSTRHIRLMHLFCTGPSTSIPSKPCLRLRLPPQLNIRALSSAPDGQKAGDVVAASSSTSLSRKEWLKQKWAAFKHEVHHYWIGTKLLGTEIMICMRILRQARPAHRAV